MYARAPLCIVLLGALSASTSASGVGSCSSALLQKGIHNQRTSIVGESASEYGDRDGEPIGLPSHKWLPMSIELEMHECDRTGSIHERLASHANVSKEEIHQWLTKTAIKARAILIETDPSYVADAGHSRATKLRSLHIKQSHDSDDSLHEWNWEREMTARTLLELASPIDLSEKEVKFASHASHKFVGRFYGGQASSLQVHVEGRCLLSEDRLNVLLLMWEKYHPALEKLIKVRERGHDFARSIAKGNPELLAGLQQRLDNKPTESYKSLWKRHEGSIKNVRSDRDGYRNFAINVCHLLDVKCCRNCIKNETPKFGGIEFRLFNTEFGTRFRLSVSFFERLVQASCSMPVSKLRPHTLHAGSKPAADASPLFELLHIDPLEIRTAFMELDGTRQWQKFCPT